MIYLLIMVAMIGIAAAVFMNAIECKVYEIKIILEHIERMQEAKK